MKAREDFEKVAILGRRVRDARIAQQQCEDRADGGPEDHDSEKTGGFGAVEFFDENGDDEIGLWISFRRDELPPGNDPDDGQVYRQVNQRYPDNAQKNG